MGTLFRFVRARDTSRNSLMIQLSSITEYNTVFKSCRVYEIGSNRKILGMQRGVKPSKFDILDTRPVQVSMGIQIYSDQSKLRARNSFEFK